MSKPVKILLQTTIPYTQDDWHVGRFSLLKGHLESLTDSEGRLLYEVTARDRENGGGKDDPVLVSLDGSDFDELWLFAVDAGDGLTSRECEAISNFRKRGGGILSTRDHFDLGSSLCTLGGIGAAHYFHNKNQDPDPERNRRDDHLTTSIDYPNYHSGSNGDYQRINVLSDHELLRRTDGSRIEYFPAHPHEGGVGAPKSDSSAHVVATGTSRATKRDFNLIVAFERSTGDHGSDLGRAIAESSFHHLVDYNWDTDSGCPTFVEEPPGNGLKNDPAKLDDVKTYAANAARWLAGA
jgi:hypothetical protein